jgi:hypothetical protein
VPPAALRGMVGQPAVASALRAMDDGADVRQSDFDASQFELEVNGRITGDAEQPGIVGVERFHAGTLRDRPKPAVGCHEIPGRTVKVIMPVHAIKSSPS